jgi:hypothetical protein
VADARDLLTRWRDGALDGDASLLADLTDETTDFLAQPEAPPVSPNAVNVERLDLDALRIALEWPTPNHMRRTADALDSLTPAKYGDILRWFADRCDEFVWHIAAPNAGERLKRVRDAAAAQSAAAGEGEG